MYRRNVEIEIELTYIDLAKEFCEMGATEQAAFFNEIARLSSDWKNPFAMQMCSVSISGVLKKEGRGIMRTIGEYGSVYE